MRRSKEFYATETINILCSSILKKYDENSYCIFLCKDNEITIYHHSAYINTNNDCKEFIKNELINLFKRLGNELEELGKEKTYLPQKKNINFIYSVINN